MLIKRTTKSIIYSFLALVFGLSLVGCGSSLRATEELKHKSAVQIYRTARKAMRLKRYEDAVKYYELINATHPFSPYARQGSLEIIYAHYKADDLALGIAASVRYIHLYPRSPHVDYAYYMKGILNFLSGISWAKRYLSIDLMTRDMDGMHRAFVAFDELIHLYPHSYYAKDARQHMLYIRNLFAERELNIARFYYKRHAYIAAANRASHVVKHFKRSPYVFAALRLMVKAYRAKGDTVLADRAQSVLAYNGQR